jgi:GT2 family glycosyltransferase
MSPGSPKVVVLGLMTKIPVPGVVWQTVHYLEGLRRLGFDPYYVEAHGRTPSMFMREDDLDASELAADFIGGVLHRFGFGDRWAYQALHREGRIFGLPHSDLKRLYREAALVINVHGGTDPLPEHAETGRLVYLETDPVQVQIQLHEEDPDVIRYLEPHVAFFTFAENYGRPGCLLPVSQRYQFHPTRQPVVLDLWAGREDRPAGAFTSVGNWRQEWRTVRLGDQTYTWTKDLEFRRFLDLPARCGSRFELALSNCPEADRRLLEERGWKVRPPFDRSEDLDGYRDYIRASYGEFTAAKDQNVRLRTGWFSDRSATYLAAGRPVITQDTAFDEILPTGEGLFSVGSVEEAATAVEDIDARYGRHARAAREIAREYFDAKRVLSSLLETVGLTPVRPAATRTPHGISPLPPDLVIDPVSRWPTTLPHETVASVLSRPMPTPGAVSVARPQVSVLIVVQDNLPFTRMCLESLVWNTADPPYELVIVDNGSTESTVAYLRAAERAWPRVTVIRNEQNRGFPAAVNQAFRAASGDVLVILNNDTLLPPGWLRRLTFHLEDRGIGLIGALTNRAGNEAEIAVVYRTYGEFVAFARRLMESAPRAAEDIRTQLLFCTAVRRDVLERVGVLDEGFGLGMFEDDDYVMRVRQAGYRVACAQDVFVHHFGQATLGKMAETGAYGPLFHQNRRRFEEKWGIPWQGHQRRLDEAYERLVSDLSRTITSAVPAGSTVAVVTKGDDRLLELDGVTGWHFPRDPTGVYAGHYPHNSQEAVEQLEVTRRNGAEYLVFPRTSLWWLDYYEGLRNHLQRRYRTVFDDRTSCVIFQLEREGALVDGSDGR